MCNANEFLIPTSRKDLKIIKEGVKAILIPKGMDNIEEKKIPDSVKVIVTLESIGNVVIIENVSDDVALFSLKHVYGDRVRSFVRKSGESDFQLLKRLYKQVCAEEAKKVPIFGHEESVVINGSIKADVLPAIEIAPSVSEDASLQYTINDIIERSIKQRCENLIKDMERDLKSNLFLPGRSYVLVSNVSKEDLDNAKEMFGKILNKDDLVIGNTTLTFVVRRH